MSNSTPTQLSPSELQLQNQLNPLEKNILNNPKNLHQTDSDLETLQTFIKIQPEQPAPKVRNKYDRTVKVEYHNDLPSLTQQDAKDECDINLILERFNRTGVLEHIKKHQPQYGDFTNIPDYQESLQKVIQAEAAFMELPAKVRERFQNSALKFVEFVQNPENQEELVRLGLANPPKSSPAPDSGASTAPAGATAPAAGGTAPAGA